MVRASATLLVAFAGLGGQPTVSWSQGQAVDPRGADVRFTPVDSLHDSGDVAGAMRVLDSLLLAYPDDIGVLLRASREATVNGIVSPTDDLQNEWYRRGEQLAERVLEIVPGDTAGIYWLIAAQGRRAVQSPALTAARLGVSIYDRAHFLLAQDSLHAGANHALGVLNVEVMKLPPFGRFLARTLAPHRILRDTSWENAEFFLRRAIEIQPDFPLYRLDLAKAYYLQGKFTPAREMLQSLLELSTFDVPTDSVFRAQARSYLQRIP